jgi:hypothetical protein
MATEGRNRRRAKRIPVKELYVECGEASFWNFLKKPERASHPMVDISDTGLQMLSSIGFAMSLPLDLVVMHPSGRHTVKLRGKVVYSRILPKKVRGQTLFKIGVQFTKIKDEEQSKLTALMYDKAITSGIPKE